MSDQSVHTEVAAEEALLAAMGGEDEPHEVEQDEEEVDTEQSEDTETESEPEEQEEAKEEEFIDLVVNGEQVKKSKSEVIELAQKGEDYTRKTQQLAEERRYLQAQAQVIQQQSQLQSQIVDKVAEVKAIEGQLEQYANLDWNTLIDSDPIQAMKLDRQMKALQAQYQEKVTGINQVTQQAKQQQAQFQQEMLARESQRLMEAIPEWSDAKKMSDERSQVKDFLKKVGYSDEEIAVAADHRAVVMARKAMLYDKLMSSKPEVTKKVTEAPKPIKSNAPATNKNRDAIKQSRQMLKQTGRAEHAERAIMAML